MLIIDVHNTVHSLKEAFDLFERVVEIIEPYDFSKIQIVEGVHKYFFGNKIGTLEIDKIYDSTYQLHIYVE